MSSVRRLLIAATAVLALLPPAFAQTQAVEVAGVKYEPTAQVANARLQLNGAGVRYKLVIKVYTAGLYLQNKAATPEAVLAAPGPKRLTITMLRDIDGNELGKLFTRGMQDNATREEFAKSIPGTIKMGEIFATRRKLNAGEWFAVDYVPGTGTIISVNGKPAAEPIREPEFFAALMHIWLGKNPADSQLKDALLGKAIAAGSPTSIN
jgi:hypothetical protein